MTTKEMIHQFFLAKFAEIQVHIKGHLEGRLGDFDAVYNIKNTLLAKSDEICAASQEANVANSNLERLLKGVLDICDCNDCPRSLKKSTEEQLEGRGAAVGSIIAYPCWQPASTWRTPSSLRPYV